MIEPLLIKSRKANRTAFYFRALVVAVLLTLWDANAAETTNGRVFRIVFPDNRRIETASLKCCGGTNLSGLPSITQFLTDAATNLGDRDLVLTQYSSSTRGPSSQNPNLYPLYSLCYTSRTQVCLYQVFSRQTNSLSSVMVIHWKTPWSNPRNQNKTEYFVEDTFVGKGDSGLDQALRTVIEAKSEAVAFVGSRYTDEGSFGFLESPFEQLEAEIKALLKTHEIKQAEINHHWFN